MTEFPIVVARDLLAQARNLPVVGARKGSSGSLVQVVSAPDGGLAAVKWCVRPRVSAVEQRRRRNQLAHVFPGLFPGVRFAGVVEGYDVLILDAPSTLTLADRFHQDPGREDLLPLWSDVVQRLTAVWQTTRIRVSALTDQRPTRSHSERLNRLRLDATRALKTRDVSHYSITVNGQTSLRFEDLLARLSELKPPMHFVSCHGDPQPSNVLVSERGNSFWLVDWEWSGRRHDWRMMLSHLFGWWLLDSASASRSSLRLSGENAVISCSALALESVDRLWDPIRDAFFTMTTPRTFEDDRKALYLHVATLLLREGCRLAADVGPVAAVANAVGVGCLLLEDAFGRAGASSSLVPELVSAEDGHGL